MFTAASRYNYNYYMAQSITNSAKMQCIRNWWITCRPNSKARQFST